MMENNTTYHIPVLLNECIDGLNINPDGIYVDVTFGGGGHSRQLFSKLSSKGKLIAFDQDPDAKNNAWEADNFHFIPSNFSFLSNHLLAHDVKQVDGILADLGVSSHQFDEGDRGFSFRADAPLDMRMNQRSEKSAKTIVNSCDEVELTRIFREYGELNQARRIAQAIVLERGYKSIDTTFQLCEVLQHLAPKFKEYKFFAQVFQALRIEVNEELKVLEKLLLDSADLLASNGRLVVMSYHSLEDRLVKNFLKHGSFDGKEEKDFFGNLIKPFREITRHPIVPNENEMEKNSRARSVRLRIAERNER
ncbi:MAG: 16S rRNA (cytosine(1402)-N(4))-methyltransferase RsmH [Bacteroidota bacterium]